jgi:hypothetical protein
MARYPRRDAEIGDPEHLGRRRFKRARLIGFPSQEAEPALTYLDFLDERDYNISTDRLGPNGIDTKIKDRLALLARASAESRVPKMVFLGWANVQVKKFLKEARGHRYSIKPDPISGAESEDNEFHAVICCPTDRTHLEVALYLCHVFQKHGGTIDAEAVPASGPVKSALAWLMQFAPWRRKD